MQFDDFIEWTFYVLSCVKIAMNSNNIPCNEPWGLEREILFSFHTCLVWVVQWLARRRRLQASLSPVATGTGSQSLPCGQVNLCPTNDAQSASDTSSELELPQRRGQKSKKVIRAKNKAKRKRGKITRKKNKKNHEKNRLFRLPALLWTIPIMTHR